MTSMHSDQRPLLAESGPSAYRRFRPIPAIGVAAAFNPLRALAKQLNLIQCGCSFELFVEETVHA